MLFIERECTRRCFWLVQLMAWVSHIYTHREVKPRMVQLADVVRLPIDETTFELASLSSSASEWAGTRLVRRDADLVGCLLASEYLRRPAPRTRYASQFGHVLRILEIYHTVESVLGASSRRASAAIGF